MSEFEGSAEVCSESERHSVTYTCIWMPCWRGLEGLLLDERLGDEGLRRVLDYCVDQTILQLASFNLVIRCPALASSPLGKEANQRSLGEFEPVAFRYAKSLDTHFEIQINGRSVLEAESPLPFQPAALACGERRVRW